MQKGILADGFGIFYDDAELDDDRQVKEIGIKAGSALEVMQK